MPLTPDQEKIIELNAGSKSDRELATELGVTPRMIKTFRVNKGIKKVKGKKSEIQQTPEEFETESKIVNKKEDDYQKWKGSKEYLILSQSFTEEELQFYFEKRFKYVMDIEQSGEYLTYAETIALDNLIQTELRMGRFTKMEKDFIKTINDATENIDVQTNARYQLMNISKEMRGLQETFTHQQASLEMTRQERTKKKQNTKISIQTIVDEIKDRKVQLGICLTARLDEMVIQKLAEQWRKNGVLHDSEGSMPINDED